MSSRDPVVQRIINRNNGQSQRIPLADFPNVNKLGTGNLLHEAAEELRRVVKIAMWELQELSPIYSKQLKAVEAHRFMLSRDKSTTFIMPLCAKNYPIRVPLEGGALWFSVAESVINAALQYDSNVVLTYLNQSGHIYATHAGTARPDDYGGDYLRFNERYYGWAAKDWLRLDKFLEAPDRLNYQTRLSP